MWTWIKCNVVPCKRLSAWKEWLCITWTSFLVDATSYFCYLIKFARFPLFVFFNNFKKSCFRSLCLVKGIVFSKWSCLKHVFANLNFPYTVTSYCLELKLIKWKFSFIFYETKEDKSNLYRWFYWNIIDNYYKE